MENITNYFDFDIIVEMVSFVCTEDVECTASALGLFGGKMLSDHLLLAVGHQVTGFFLLCDVLVQRC